MTFGSPAIRNQSALAVRSRASRACERVGIGSAIRTACARRGAYLLVVALGRRILPVSSVAPLSLIVWKCRCESERIDAKNLVL